MKDILSLVFKFRVARAVTIGCGAAFVGTILAEFAPGWVQAIVVAIGVGVAVYVIESKFEIES